MAMILPERTVDAWTATYITGRRWRARLWAPTEQLPDERYDLAAGLGRLSHHLIPRHPDPWPDKVFVLEHKGVDETSAGAPFVLIRGRQLAGHLMADRGRGGRLVYYVLPDPKWRGRQPAPYGVLPDVAARRTKGPMRHGRTAWDGFQLWTVVAHVEDVAAALKTIGARSPGRLVARRPHGSSPADLWCALGMSDLHAIPNAVNLRDFISGVRDCTHGRLITDPSVAGPPLRPQPAGPPLIGPSLDGLVSALGIDATLDLRGEDETDKLELSDVELSALANRPPVTTYYGIGDSDEASVGEDDVPD